jgi:hypothetical protein
MIFTVSKFVKGLDVSELESKHVAVNKLIKTSVCVTNLVRIQGGPKVCVQYIVYSIPTFGSPCTFKYKLAVVIIG